MTINRKIIGTLPLLAQARFAYAADPSFPSLVNDLISFLEGLFPLAVAIVLLFTLWQGALFMFSEQSEKDVEAVRRRLTAGVLALFVTSSLWGLVKIIQSTVGII